MNTITRTLGRLGAALLALTSLTSCYLNTAEHLFDAASHNALVTTDDIRTGNRVYKSAEGNYYIELPSYRHDKPITTVINLREQRQNPPSKEPQTTRKDDKVVVRISQDFAMGLMGKSSLGSAKPTLEPTTHDSSFLSTCTPYRVTTTAPGTTKQYSYNSSLAPLWYTLGAFDWMCVDLPGTFVLSCCEVVVLSTKILNTMANTPTRYGGSGGGGSDSGSTCPSCGGRGYLIHSDGTQEPCYH